MEPKNKVYFTSLCVYDHLMLINFVIRECQELKKIKLLLIKMGQICHQLTGDSSADTKLIVFRLTIVLEAF